jgi:hypothetical protein
MGCGSCGIPLEQPKIGRKRLYCSRRCKKRAERERSRSQAVVASLSTPEPPLTTPETPRRGLIPSLSRRRIRSEDVVLEEEAPHVVTTYTGEEWLARNRAGFSPGGFIR